jgi:hypothetical protein
MRQVTAFMRALHKRNTTKEYYHLAFFAKLNNAEMPSLDSILQVSSEEDTPFTSEQDKIMEARAMKILEENKRMSSI